MLAIFDVEGVLLDAEFLPLLAEKVNKQDKIWDITKKGIQGAINWEEGLRARIELLKGMSYETCKEVAYSLPIMTGAKQACSTLKQAGWKLMAISGGFSIITNRLKEELELDFVFSNELIFKDRKLDGVKIDVDSDKARSAKLKIEEWKQDKKDIVVIVDGANDITLFNVCGLGIAFRAQDVVKDLATVTLEQKNLSLLIDIINRHYKINLQVPTVA